MEGTCTGEHGVGQGKAAFLQSRSTRPRRCSTMMRAIKQALDPQDIMNPGKILPLQM